MLLMAEVTNEMGAQLRVAAQAQGIPIAEEIGRRLERLERLETQDTGGEMRVPWGLMPDVVDLRKKVTGGR
jgi:hypothetical protein